MDFADTFRAISGFFTTHKEMLTILGALIGGGLALKRYWSDQSWRKKQFAYDYVQNVFSDGKAMTALRMLDWSSGSIPHEIAKEYELAADDRSWDQDDVAGALRPHDQDPSDPLLGGYSDKEYVIRELFDTCLAHFERLGHFMKSGVISKEDFPTTLSYYAQIMREPRLQPIHGPLRTYMKRYGFGNALYLFDKLGSGSAAN